MCDPTLDVSTGGSDPETPPPSESTYIGDAHRASVIRDPKKAYEWKKFAPSGAINFTKWLIEGVSSTAKLSDEEVESNTRKLARMLSLLREYESRFGMPEGGGPRDQQWVLTELCTRLYGSGTPLWVLKPVMSKAAEGLTGARGVDFVLLPRNAFIYAPTSGATVMFSMERGFKMYMMSLTESVLIRLASFASNTRTVNSVQARSPKAGELLKAARGQSTVFGRGYRREALAKEILDLASGGVGLFFFTRAESEKQKQNGVTCSLNGNGHQSQGNAMDSFWVVEPEIRELFTRLATIEAEASIDAIRELPPASKMYPRAAVIFFRMISAAGASGLWFGASWPDMIVAGFLGVIVTLCEGANLWKHERIIFEVVVCFIVGLSAGLIAHTWPGRTCFGAMAVAAVIDILQGFRVVYSIMEIMSKHTVSGGADFLEALLFTGLIAYGLKFGLAASEGILGKSGSAELDGESFNECTDPIDQMWYLLLVPITSFAWSVLFMPHYRDLPLMTLHGILSYVVYWAIETNTGNGALATFIAAMSVTASSGIVSRFTGRQALGDTVTGLYVLLPGAYLTKGLFQAAEQNVIDASLLSNIVVIAVTIGIGGWTGTILCSPTILGTNRGLLKAAASKNARHAKPVRQGSSTVEARRAMLFF